MAYQVTEAVLKHSQAEGAARMVLFALSVHAQPDGSNARPGNSLLAKETKLSIRGVEYAIKSLLASGEICRETMGGGATSTSYKILMPGLGEINQPLNTFRGAATSIASDTPELHSGGTPANGNITPECNSAPNTDTPRKSRQVPPQIATGTPANGDIAYKEEPEREPEREPEGESADASAREARVSSPVEIPTLPPVVRVIHATATAINPAAEIRLHEIAEAVRMAFGWSIGVQPQVIESQALQLAGNPNVTPGVVAAYAAQRDRAIYHKGFAGDLLTWFQRQRQAESGGMVRAPSQFTTRNTVNNRAALEEAKRQMAERQVKQKQG